MAQPIFFRVIILSMPLIQAERVRQGSVIRGDQRSTPQRERWFLRPAACTATERSGAIWPKGIGKAGQARLT
ncbi:hypothetical protein DBR33_05425 [Stenotrophomonas sp. HMWF022]|nr:hypothetical protein DBR33_05425 [Stenotrophomonas sp. HMWF022]